MQKQAIGVDIGGSHVTAHLVDLGNNAPVEKSKVRVPLNNMASKEKILQHWANAIHDAAGKFSVESLCGIGFAMPGPFDYQNGIARFDENVQKFVQLYGVNIRLEIQKILNLPADFPVRFLNDASCFAIGEAWHGKASEFNRIIAITLGTGFGSTFIKNRIPVSGTGNLPDDGFLYHVPFKNSIADDYFSTRWFLKEYETKTGAKLSGVKELIKRIKTDTVAQELFDTFGKNLGEFLTPWNQHFKAECIVLGGNISNGYQHFEKQMKTQFRKNRLQPEIYVSTLGEDAALIGSARLSDDDFYHKLLKKQHY